jgi:hypothetical protein
MANFNIPFGFQMYGRISVEAETLKEAYKRAEEKLGNMTTSDMLDNASYLENSENIDEDGIVYKDGVLL